MRDNLKAARQNKGLTQEMLARKINITLRHYQDIEYGYKKGSVNIWQKLSETLEESISHLFQQAGNNQGKVSV